MKLRIRGNSVRIRVTRSEVARLGAGGRVEQVTQFSAGARLRSSIEPSVCIGVPFAELVDSSVRVFIPAGQLRAWADSDQVTIDAAQDAGDGTSLQILVEKDFECIHSSAEGNADAFPNPRERAQPCVSH